MALIQCTGCGEKIIEKDDEAILACPVCGNTIIKVIKESLDNDEETTRI